MIGAIGLMGTIGMIGAIGLMGTIGMIGAIGLIGIIGDYPLIIKARGQCRGAHAKGVPAC